MKKIKNIVSVFLSVVLFVMPFSTTVFAVDSTDDIAVGDVDCSGKVDTEDVRIVLKAATGIVAVSDNILSFGDMNDDGMITIEDAVLLLKKVAFVESSDIPNQTGENFLSDSPDNEFIALIAKKYNLDPASLVAIYSEPDTGVNYVLRFGGNKTDGYPKSRENLTWLYHIGKAPERKISYTNGQYPGIHYNCSMSDGIIAFNLVKTTVMDQYPTYFTD